LCSSAVGGSIAKKIDFRDGKFLDKFGVKFFENFKVQVNAKLMRIKFYFNFFDFTK
jgi:hypothetical protein